jgi:hypothetical protein
MPVKNTGRNYIHMAVSVRYVTSPDTEMRLSRAIDILLESAAHNQNTPTGSRKHRKEKSSAQISEQSGFGVQK